MKKENTTIIKSNVLLEGNHRFNLTEMKILLAVIVQIDRKDTEFRDYRVHIRGFLKLMRVHKKSYNHIRKACRSFKSKVIEIKTDNGILFTSYFSDIQIYTNHGYIDFTISPKLKPYLLQLKKNFTIYDIRNIIQCRSVYSIKIYQLLKQYEKIGVRPFTIDELRKILGLPDGYKRWGNLKDRIIDVAQKELLDFSDLYFEYTTKRKDRSIHSITFTIKRQTKTPIIKEKGTQYIDLTANVVSETARLKSNDTITSKQFKELAK